MSAIGISFGPTYASLLQSSASLRAVREIRQAGARASTLAQDAYYASGGDDEGEETTMTFAFGTHGIDEFESTQDTEFAATEARGDFGDDQPDQQQHQNQREARRARIDIFA